MKIRTICLALLACACSDAPSSSDSGSSAITDAGFRLDAETEEDASTREDASTAEDAETIDSGATPNDAGTTPNDSGTISPDSGTTASDSGANEDAGQLAPDASTPADSGVVIGNCPSGSGTGTTPNAQMSFFVTSIGNGAAGGNYGGLAGADQRCQCLAQQVGMGNKTWRAYLSTQAPLVNARDRIGTGPWFNYAGAQVGASVDALHNTPPGPSLLLTERGDPVPRMEHDILTGSTTDGRLYQANGAPLTCGDWTTNDSGFYGWVGHSDWMTGNVTSWNSWHESSCDQAGLASRLGSGRIYCFALD